MRPRTLEGVLGQEATAEGSLLRRALEHGRLSSMVLWGPPGSGKPTLARVLAGRTGDAFETFSAVLSGVADVRRVVAAARERRVREGRGTVLFVDEIHRFNRAQQDAFLPHVEAGTITLVGATTENPSFHLNAALLSRCLVIALDPLPEEALTAIAERALVDRELGLGGHGIRLDEESIAHLARSSHGDARSLLTRLEAVVEAAVVAAGPDRQLGLEEVERLTATKAIYHDRAGEAHFNLVSAFHKSVRGDDPQAALYWLARMLEGGEEPLFVCRRMVRIAAEDIGLADPRAIEVALAATEAYRFLGSPEGELALVNAALYLACAPKSVASYRAHGEVVREIREGAVHPVPLHIRNAPTRVMKELGYGAGYAYPADDPAAAASQTYLPPELAGREWYRPSDQGLEERIARRLVAWRAARGRDEREES